MGKLDEMRRMTAENVDESMGVGRPAVHGAQVATGPSAPARWQGVAKSKTAAEIPVSRIIADPKQPREEFDPDALARLKESLSIRGVLQPILVRWDEGRGSYVIIAGERRWKAAGMAGLSTIPCVVDDRIFAPGELLATQLVENALREDLKPIEQAKAYRSLIEANGWTVSQLARELAVDHSNVSRALALLEVPDSVQNLVEQGALPASVAYEVSKLNNPADQVELAERAAAGMTRAEVVEAVNRSRPGRAKGRGIRRTTETIRMPGGVKVTVERTKGVDLALVREALVGALASVEARLAGKTEAA